VVYRVFGHHPFAVKVLQVGMLAGLTWLVFRIAQRAAGRRQADLPGAAAEVDDLGLRRDVGGVKDGGGHLHEPGRAVLVPARYPAGPDPALTADGVKHELTVVPRPHDYVWNRGPGSAELLAVGPLRIDRAFASLGRTGLWFDHPADHSLEQSGVEEERGCLDRFEHGQRSGAICERNCARKRASPPCAGPPAKMPDTPVRVL